MNNPAHRLDLPSLESTRPAPAPPAFDFPNDEERAVFEDICDYTAERAAILEYEQGFTAVDAEHEAERRAMDRYPPSATARAAIIAHADRLAAHYGFPDWDAAQRLGEGRIRRLHVNPGHWDALRETFAAARATGGRRKP